MEIEKITKAKLYPTDLREFVEQALKAQGYEVKGGLSVQIFSNFQLDLELLPLGQTITVAQDAVKENPPVVTGRPHKTKDTGLTESDQAKQDAKRAYWRDQAKKKRELAKVGAEVKNQSQSVSEVVAPTTSPFQVNDLLSNLITTSSY